jgi:hypothetical protein
MSDQETTPDAKSQQDSPMGPACLVVGIFFAVAISVTFIVVAWMMTGKQGERANRAIQDQLIPWVSQSPLDPTDKQSVIEQLSKLVSDINANQYDERQLLRLFAVLSDSPVLQWGVVQQVNARAAKSGLTEAEREALQMESDRLLRLASQGGLGLQQLEFVVQKVAAKDRKSGTLTMVESVTDADLREFLQRAKSTADRRDIPQEPFPSSVSQVLRGLIELALSKSDNAPPVGSPQSK